MIFPRWYKIMFPFWAILAPSFWWFATTFNGESFFSLPQLASASEGAGWQLSLALQMIIIAVLLAPLSLLPLVLINQRKLKKLNHEKANNAEN
ncbi:hypothetical protein SAMN02745824_0529 [Parasphingorhabdus marina DSM 22363]|uniref:Uncharacterized protein n=1 Tax=Parasphingorhabdus marina DSM 22363 TaxID=1123272 RepID=A0A1N6CNE3_9SPHN|nr:hypothetical protein [Parasphingorhabdus marina]SIN59989.1 hypothetical protein SAMN02745824_0529 [Parasphingorhabdus marina DSM 22363]